MASITPYVPPSPSPSDEQFDSISVQGLPKTRSFTGNNFVNFSWGIGDELSFFVSPTPKSILSNQNQLPNTNTNTQHNQSSSSSSSKSKFKTNGSDVPLGKIGEFYVMKWNRLLQTERKFVASSHTEFINVQENSAKRIARNFSTTTPTPPSSSSRQRSHGDWSVEAKYLAKRYRGIIIDQIREIEDYMQNVKNNNFPLSKTLELEYAKIYQSYIDMYQVWWLCEIFFLNSPASVITTPLIEWWCGFSQTTTDLQNITARIEDNTQYWYLICTHLVNANHRIASDLLQTHSLVASRVSYSQTQRDISSIVRDLAVLIKDYPSSHGVMAPSEYKVKFESWRNKGRALRDELERFKSSTSQNNYLGLKDVLNIVTGDIVTIQKQCETWYGFCVAQLLYVDPTRRAQDIKTLVDDCRTRMGIYDDEGISQVFRVVMSLDLPDVIEQTWLYFAGHTKWFHAHFVDLLYHAGIFSSGRDEITDGEDWRKHFIILYASELLSTPALWEITATYFGQCIHLADNFNTFDDLGKRYIEELVSRQSIRDEKKLLKLVHLCNQHNLSESVVKSLYRVIATQKWIMKMYGASIHWLLVSKDSTRLSQVANKILWSVMSVVDSGYFDKNVDSKKLNMLDQVQEAVEGFGGEGYTRSDRLAFLGKYRELLWYQVNKDYEKYAKLAVWLLSTRLAPKRFWIDLIINAVYLIEMDQKIINQKNRSFVDGTTNSSEENEKNLYFGVDDTRVLMNCLEELCLSHRSDTFLREISDTKIQTIRVSLTHNMAEALCNPISVTQKTKQTTPQPKTQSKAPFNLSSSSSQKTSAPSFLNLINNNSNTPYKPKHDVMSEV